ncbi:BamA/TamA family outer membrane protein [Flammeovirga aprica]|uniref:BamA/TamA family outer membrane protein n=1 Tax=Flammeovirga aprica JL-4 TaxID=694437 RepID=A0A7X9XB26_9BACT|nr:BamA/TamA family outer membrane protein [Flammeovirga aprica]NME70287.1 BamA/TamA family outer membrane protein [Flammeovirga aprica JL-4]
MRFLFIFLFSLLSLSSFAQLGGMGGGSDRIKGKAKFIPLPYVDYGVQSGATIGAIPVLMFNPSEKDTLSPSSSVGVFSMYSESRTWMVMAFGQFYLNEDKWRISTVAGVGDFNFQTFVGSKINRWYRYNAVLDYADLQVSRKVFKDIYAGMGYTYTRFNTTFSSDIPQNTSTIHGLTLEVSIDKRSNVSYPRSGYLIKTNFVTHPAFLGNTQKSNQLTLEYNHYFPVRRNKDVFATRLFTGMSVGDVNFNHQFVVGETDIRGYSYGRFRGNSIIALQAEYRCNFTERWGMVGFAGVATVFGANNKADDGRLLPGGGVGFRYTYLKDTNSKVGFDIAQGDGDWGFYFRLSEAF